MPGIGAGKSALPPPEIRQRQRSAGPSDATSSRIARVPSTPSAVGSLTPAGRAACSRTARVGTTQLAGTLTQPEALFSLRTSLAEGVFQGGDHPRPGLARPDDRDPADPVQVDLIITDQQRSPLDSHPMGEQVFRLNGAHAGPPDLLDITAELRSGAGHCGLVVRSKE